MRSGRHPDIGHDPIPGHGVSGHDADEIERIGTGQRHQLQGLGAAAHLARPMPARPGAGRERAKPSQAAGPWPASSESAASSWLGKSRSRARRSSKNSAPPDPDAPRVVFAVGRAGGQARRSYGVLFGTDCKYLTRRLCEMSLHQRSCTSYPYATSQLPWTSQCPITIITESRNRHAITIGQDISCGYDSLRGSLVYAKNRILHAKPIVTPLRTCRRHSVRDRFLPDTGTRNGRARTVQQLASFTPSCANRQSDYSGPVLRNCG